MIHKVRKPLRSVVAEAIDRGCWRLEKTGRMHGHSLRLVHDTGRIVPVSNSATSESLASRKLRSQLLRIERGLTGSP